jgi:hypothetical protein
MILGRANIACQALNLHCSNPYLSIAANNVEAPRRTGVMSDRLLLASTDGAETEDVARELDGARSLTLSDYIPRRRPLPPTTRRSKRRRGSDSRRIGRPRSIICSALLIWARVSRKPSWRRLRANGRWRMTFLRDKRHRTLHGQGFATSSISRSGWSRRSSRMFRRGLGLRLSRTSPHRRCAFEPDGTRDRGTLHAGLPVTRGEKWLLSQWIGRPPDG